MKVMTMVNLVDKNIEYRHLLETVIEILIINKATVNDVYIKKDLLPNQIIDLLSDARMSQFCNEFYQMRLNEFLSEYRELNSEQNKRTKNLNQTEQVVLNRIKRCYNYDTLKSFWKEISIPTEVADNIIENLFEKGYIALSEMAFYTIKKNKLDNCPKVRKKLLKENLKRRSQCFNTFLNNKQLELESQIEFKTEDKIEKIDFLVEFYEKELKNMDQFSLSLSKVYGKKIRSELEDLRIQLQVLQNKEKVEEKLTDEEQEYQNIVIPNIKTLNGYETMVVKMVYLFVIKNYTLNQIAFEMKRSLDIVEKVFNYSDLDRLFDSPILETIKEKIKKEQNYTSKSNEIYKEILYSQLNNLLAAINGFSKKENIEYLNMLKDDPSIDQKTITYLTKLIDELNGKKPKIKGSINKINPSAIYSAKKS